MTTGPAARYEWEGKQGYYSANGQRCFVCSRPVADPAIAIAGVYAMAWPTDPVTGGRLGTRLDGGTADIVLFLHPECAAELCERMNRDGLEADVNRILNDQDGDPWA